MGLIIYNMIANFNFKHENKTFYCTAAMCYLRVTVNVLFGPLYFPNTFILFTT